MVELLIFLAILAMISGLVLPLLFTASQTRYQQATVAAVEQNGAQAMQDILSRVRSAETITSPLPTKSGSYLVLQTSSGAQSPIIIGMQSGSLILIEHALQRPLTSPEVGVTSFFVRNTSAATNRQSVVISFKLARATRQSTGPDTYERYFETAVALFVDDQITPTGCTCTLPTCTAPSTVNWQICDVGVCTAKSASLKCP